MDLTVQEQLSPNCGPRRNGLRPELIVLHYTAMRSAEAAIARLCDPAAEVSAHYLISGQGVVTLMVPEDQRAWHAGAGEWCGLDDVNSRSIGIELDNRGDHPFSEPQMQSLERLLRGIMARWGIAPAGVIGHSDMAPGRKVDPGRRFDWHRLERIGLARQSGQGNTPTQPLADDFRNVTERLGYTSTMSNETRLKAVRLRHRPQATGPLHLDDFAALPKIT